MGSSEVRYRPTAVLRLGASGVVYRAVLEGREVRPEVALRILPDGRTAVRDRLSARARRLGRVRDRAVVGCEAPIRAGGRWVEVSDLVEGHLWSQALAAGPVPPGVVAEVVGEVARALHNVWTQEDDLGQPLQLVHGSLLPENVLVTPTGEVKLLDFGARVPGPTEPGPAEDVASLAGLLGEPVAPELAELAAKCRASEARRRPTAREVERLCRELRRRSVGPDLREWMDRLGPPAALPDDDRVGVPMVLAKPDEPIERTVPPPAVAPGSASRRPAALVLALGVSGVALLTLAAALGWVLAGP